MDLVETARLGPRISQAIDALGRDLFEQRARLMDRSMYDAFLVEMLLRYARAERELRELNELKNRFLGMAAHDLRNPLAALRGMAELMLSAEPEAELRRQMLEEMHKAADDMLRLVNDLLDVAAIESGKLVVRPRASDLAQLARARLKLVAHAAQTKRIGITTDLPDTAIAVCDPDRCAEVLDNLLTNAIKFSPPGSRVHVTVRSAGDGVSMSVRDHGPGLTQADRSRLFGTFQKLSARPTAGEKSTGLGLAIVKKIVDAHHGAIAVADAPGGGAEFTVTIPAGG